MDELRESKKAALDRFLADNPELEAVSARLSIFNVFNVLKIEKAEIRHSNVLGWLLDPQESHGLRDVFLRRFLSNLLLEAETGFSGLSAADVEMMQFDGVEVRREWEHIDLLIIDRRNALVVLIENKITSGESKGQLEKYKRVVDKEFPTFQVIPVYLTLAGDDAADDENSVYISYSHIQILSILERIVAQRSEQLSEPVSVFLNHYMDTLRRITMEDKDLVKLCKTIYSRHRDAIDMIVEYGKRGISQQVAEEILSSRGSYEILSTKTTWVWFIPRSWSQYLPENGAAWTRLPRPLSIAGYIRFQTSNNRACLIFEITAMSDPGLRLACVEQLRSAGFNLSNRAFREDAKYSVFLSKFQEVSDLNDKDEVATAVEKILDEAKKEFPKAEKVFKEVFSQDD